MDETKTTMPKLSIITVNLNNKAGLQKTIDSVISQTYEDFEWIVIDGGSTDGSKELIEQYADHITYWVSEPDKGIYNAMNKGIRVAKGEYLQFLNSGDFFLDIDILKSVVRFLQSENDIVFGYVVRNVKGRLLKLTTCITNDDITLSDLYFRSIPHQGSFLKRNLFERIGLYDEDLRIVGDRKFYMQAVIYGNAKLKFIPLVIAYFDGGGVSSTSPIYHEERKMVMDSLVPPRIYQDMMQAVSKKEVCKRPFFSFLYACLYRAAVNYEKLRVLFVQKRKYC